MGASAASADVMGPQVKLTIFSPTKKSIFFIDLKNHHAESRVYANHKLHLDRALRNCAQVRPHASANALLQGVRGATLSRSAAAARPPHRGPHAPTGPPGVPSHFRQTQRRWPTVPAGASRLASSCRRQSPLLPRPIAPPCPRTLRQIVPGRLNACTEPVRAAPRPVIPADGRSSGQRQASVHQKGLPTEQPWRIGRLGVFERHVASGGFAQPGQQVARTLLR